MDGIHYTDRNGNHQRVQREKAESFAEGEQRQMTDLEKANAFINDLVEIYKPVVKEIEASMMMTKDHYGEYMNVIGQGNSNSIRQLTAVALVKAGANKDGVLAALRIMGVI